MPELSRYSRAAQAAMVKCLSCNAPAVEVDEHEYACIDCGSTPVRPRRAGRFAVERDGIRVEKAVEGNGRYSSTVRFTIRSTCDVPVAVCVGEPVHETIQPEVELNGTPQGCEWTRSPHGLTFKGIVEPDSVIETGYEITTSSRDPHLIGAEPTIESVDLVDPGAVDQASAPMWRGGSASTKRATELNGGSPTADPDTIKVSNGSGVEVQGASTAPTSATATALESADRDVFEELPAVPESPTTPEAPPSYLLPPGSAETPVISVVLPTKNEERGIGPCIEAIISALETLEVRGEIVVSDSSTDRTAEIARSYGAKVVTPRRDGYGAAYQYGFEHARGDYIVMGDADTTYDFEELPKLFRRVESGEADLIMGSRFAGEIKEGAMPWLHRRIGNPLLTKFLNAFYDADVTDAHSGFRVISREALDGLDLHSDGMEFASEMVMAAGERGCSIAEVPITYHPRVGEAKLHSLSDGWRHVKFMLTNTPTHLFSMPAVVLTGLGVLTMALSLLNVRAFGVLFGTHAMIAGSLLTIIGYQVASLAVFSAVAGTAIRNPSDRITGWVRERFALEHGATLGLVMYTVGAVYVAAMVVRWVSSGYSAVPFLNWNMVAFTLIVIGVQTVFYSFFLSLLGQRSERLRE